MIGLLGGLCPPHLVSEGGSSTCSLLGATSGRVPGNRGLSGSHVTVAWQPLLALSAGLSIPWAHLGLKSEPIRARCHFSETYPRGWLLSFVGSLTYFGSFPSPRGHAALAHELAWAAVPLLL